MVGKTPTGIPVVQLEFRANSDGWFSPDNQAQLIVDGNVDSLNWARSRIAEKTTWRFAAS